MQALQEQLKQITSIFENLSKTDVASIEDAKSLKSLTIVIDRVLTMMTREVANLEQLKIRALDKLSQKIESVRPALEAAEAKFSIKYTKTPKYTPPAVEIDIGDGIMFSSMIYAKKEDIPYMSYGAIIHRKAPMLVYRFGRNDFVSVTSCHVMDFNSSGDNHRTICCGNSVKCEYGTNCKYFHDPLLWPASDHVQKFIRTNMVKRCLYFGHSSLFLDQSELLTFENLRTLARYCAIMNALISIVSKKNEK